MTKRFGGEYKVEEPSRLVLTIFPRLTNGSSLMSYTGEVTLNNVEQFHVPPSRIDAIRQRLTALGLNVIGSSLISITVELNEQQLAEYFSPAGEGKYQIPVELLDLVGGIR